MSDKKWQYFMHAISIPERIIQILHSGKIKACGYDNSVDMNDYEYCKKGVYCHYIFNDIPYLSKSFVWNYYKYIIVLKPQVAKDLEMYACDNVSYGNCVNHKEGRVSHSKGNLRRMPTMAKLKAHILNKINEVKNNRRELPDSYIYNHEVVFPDIPIEYISAILVPARANVTNIENTIKQLNLPIKVVKYSRTNDFHKYFEQI